MADKIVIEGMGKPYDGEWELDIPSLTTRELHRIKVLTGLRTGEIEEALSALDTDLFLGFAVVALDRYDVQYDIDRLWDAPMGSIRLVLGKLEDDALPPALTPPSEGGDDTESSPASKPTSGGDSETTSGSQESDPSPTGGQTSPTSAT